MKKIFLLILLLFLPIYCFGTEYPEWNNGLVYDQVEILNNKNKIEKKLENFEKKTNYKLIIILTSVNSDLKTYAEDLMKKWNLSGVDNKEILFFIDVSKNISYIDLNYELKNKLDLNLVEEMKGKNIDSVLKSSDYDKATNIGINNLQKLILGEYDSLNNKSNSGFVFGVIFFLIIIFVILAASSGRGGRHRIVSLPKRKRDDRIVRF